MVTDYSPPTGVPVSGGPRVQPEALSDLSLRQLLSFRAVADEGSFHGAADALDYTQSAVSQHVMALEGALGVRLFDRSRGRRTVALTEAGRLLLAPCRDDHRPAPGGPRRPARLRGGRDRAPSASASTRASGRRSCRRSSAASPRRGRPSRSSSASRSATRACWSSSSPGQLDLTFGVLPLPEGPFDGVELLSDPFVLVVPAGSPLASLTGPPPMTLIGEQRLIGNRACRSTRWVEQQLRAGGAEPNFVFRSEDNGTVQAMAGAGLGTALVPLLAVDTVGPGDLRRSRPASTPGASRSCGTATATGRRRREAFVEIALEVCRELGAGRETRVPTPG